MRLTILGTGSARPVGDSAQSGILVEADGTASCSTSGAGSPRRSSSTHRRHESLPACSSGTSTPITGSTSGRCATASRGASRRPAPLPVFLPPGGREKLDHLAAAINERPGFFEPGVRDHRVRVRADASRSGRSR